MLVGGAPVTRIVVDEPDVAEEGPVSERGYQVEEIDRRCDMIARRLLGVVPREMTITCGLDGCTVSFTGTDTEAFALRDAHRAEQHPGFKVVKGSTKLKANIAARDKARDSAVQSVISVAAERAERRKANAAAPKPPGKKGRPAASRGVLLHELRAFHERTGRSPRERDLTRGQGMHGVSTYARHFGSLSKALETAGLPAAGKGRPFKDAA